MKVISACATWWFDTAIESNFLPQKHLEYTRTIIGRLYSSSSCKTDEHKQYLSQRHRQQQQQWPLCSQTQTKAASSTSVSYSSVPFLHLVLYCILLLLLRFFLSGPRMKLEKVTIMLFASCFCCCFFLPCPTRFLNLLRKFLLVVPILILCCT